MANKKEYTNEDIVSLKGEDRVRKRPAVIFGSDGLEGCKHSVFEILSNSIDEARDGHGDKIIVTKYNDDSIEVEDFGRGCPVDYNQREKKYNWELVYCELYAGGKYNNNGGDNYEYSLGLNGLGACATQYSSEFMDVEVFRDGYKYDLHFEKGRNVGGLKKEETKQKKTGTKTHWRPDLEVFTDIKIENEYFEDVLKKQAVVNPNITFILRIQRENNSFEEKTFYYENGIADYVAEIAGEKPLTSVQFFTGDRKGRDREDKDDYKVKLSVAFTFSNQVKCLEYYHNSSFLEHGGSPEDAVKSAFTSQINAYLKSNNKYLKNEKPITFQDIEDCLVLVSSSFSTQTSYANQTKKAITNKFIKECMTEFLKHNLEIYFIENPDEAVKIAEQVLVNKRSREKAEKSRIDLKKKLAGSIDLSNQVQKFVDCRSKDLSQRELYIVEGVNRSKEHMLSRWHEVVGSLEKAHKHFNKPIMFAEIGVRNEEGCTQYPWDFHDRLDKPLDEQEQADFYDTAMEATWDLDWFCGYFWWDWKAILPPIEKAKENRDFTVYGKLGEEVLKKWYTKD